MPRVLITGLGLQCGLGNLQQAWRRLCQDDSAVKVCQPDGADFPQICGVPAADYDLKPYLPDKKMAKYMNPATALTVMAAGMALENAGLLKEPTCRDMALFISTGHIAFDLSRVTDAVQTCKTEDNNVDLVQMGTEGLSRCNPLMPFKMLLNMPLGLVSIVFGIGGENFILYPGADQGGVALETAVNGITGGRFERALVGGGAQPLSLLPLLTMDRLARVARAVEVRSGWAFADAGAFLVLESEQAAESRKALPLAEISNVTIAGRTGNPSNGMTRLWQDCHMQKVPDGVVVTGCLNEEDDAFYQRSIAQAWPEKAPLLMSFDRHLGYAGAAAIPMATALGANCIAKKDAPRWTGLKQPQDLMICSRIADEHMVAVRIKQTRAIQ